MKTRFFVTVLLVFILSMSVNLPATRAAGINPIDLGTLGGNWSTGVKISETGILIGYSATATNETHGFLWSEGMMVDLGTLGGSFSQPLDINNGSQIVGVSLTSEGHEHAFLWESGTMMDLGTLGGSYAYANDINTSGDIAGCGTIAGDQYWHAIYWKNKELVDLGALFGGDSCASSINNRGQILGYFVTESGDEHSFLYENGIVQDLGTFEGAVLTDLTESGKVLGKTFNSNGDVMGTIWDGKQFIDMGRIDGAVDMVLLGMNTRDQVVGYYLDEQWSEHYFVWQKAVYQYVDFIIIGINNNGTILGSNRNNREGLLWNKQSIDYFSGIEGNTIYPSYISNNGSITGQCVVNTDYPHACLWTN